jgi:glucosamine-6-phosphate deaminase
MTKLSCIKTIQVDQIKVEIYPDRAALGCAAATDIANRIQTLLKEQKIIRMVFAAAPSQNEMLDELTKNKDIDWSRIVAFHMDEYIGLPVNSPLLFGSYLKNNIFNKVSFKEVHLVNDPNTSPENLCIRYAGLLSEAPVDIICMGIGENGHIAFNDPPVADFEDTLLVKDVLLDEACRQQQVNDGCFPTIDVVPEKAITLTVPALLSGKYLFVVVPGKTKALAVDCALNGKISTACPASVLRNHNNAKLYLDLESSERL